MNPHNQTDYIARHFDEKGRGMSWPSDEKDSTVMIIQSKDYRPGYVFGERIILRRIEGSTPRDPLQWETISEAELEALGPTDEERRRALDTVFDDDNPTACE